MIAYILCGVLVLQAVMHRVERRDLYNRIMSKNLTEYKNEHISVKSAHRRAIDKWRGKEGEKE